MIHHFSPTHYHSTLGSHAPVLHVSPGDTVITTTIDANGYDERNVQVTEGVNPQTGPFYVEGAAPGDTLVVRFDRLYPNRDTGWSRAALAANVVEPEFARELPARARAIWRIDRAQGAATLAETDSRLAGFTVPLAPMLGCFGVAPEDGQFISTATCGAHGGNMDYRGFATGATVHFPVFAPGALLYLGDGHAAQGDGEITGTGIETSFDVQFTADLIKGKRIRWPRGENAEFIFTVGNARPLDQAVQHATTEMYRQLLEEYGMDPAGASILLGQCAEYDLGNMFDPAYTMVCRLRKSVLAGIRR